MFVRTVENTLIVVHVITRAEKLDIRVAELTKRESNYV